MERGQHGGRAHEPAAVPVAGGGAVPGDVHYGFIASAVAEAGTSRGGAS
ncbi:MAG: hypothetical protein R3F43_18450 [bacterium]